MKDGIWGIVALNLRRYEPSPVRRLHQPSRLTDPASLPFKTRISCITRIYPSLKRGSCTALPQGTKQIVTVPRASPPPSLSAPHSLGSQPDLASHAVQLVHRWCKLTPMMVE